MRGTLGATLGLILVAGTLFTGRPLAAHAIGGLNTVTVSPGHGKAAVPFRVTYAISPCTSAAGLSIGFSWGALAPAGRALGTAVTDSTCRATLSTAPPAKPAAGTYRVFGYVALPTGAPAPNTEASAIYTVDVTPAATTTASAAASGPSSSDQSGAVPWPGSTEGALTVPHPGSQPPWWMLGWSVGRALVLALSTLIVLAFLAVWLLRKRRLRAAAAVSKDKAT